VAALITNIRYVQLQAREIETGRGTGRAASLKFQALNIWVFKQTAPQAPARHLGSNIYWAMMKAIAL